MCKVTWCWKGRTGSMAMHQVQCVECPSCRTPPRRKDPHIGAAAGKPTYVTHAQQAGGRSHRPSPTLLASMETTA